MEQKNLIHMLRSNAADSVLMKVLMFYPTDLSNLRAYNDKHRLPLHTFPII